MSFLWSGLLALLILLPISVAAYVWSLRRRRPAAVRYSSLELIRAAAPGSSFLRRHLPFILLVAGLAPLIVGMARPVVVVPVPTDQTTIILTVDVSGSMCSSDIPPSRLQAAEEAATSFITGKASSAQIGIVAFSTFAEVVQSPTADRNQLLSSLDTLRPGAGRRSAKESSPRSTRSPRSIRASPNPRPTGRPSLRPCPRATTRPTSSCS